MVLEQTSQRKTLSSKSVGAGAEAEVKKVNKSSTKLDRKKISWWVVVLVFVTTLLATTLVGFVILSLLSGGASGNEAIIGECPSMGGVVINSDECMVELVAAQKIDFQNVVDEWANTTGGREGVIIYDLMAGEVAGEYNADEKFATASIYKLFVVYAGYMKVDSGEWGIDDTAGVTGRTIGECLDLAIRESNSECAETLWEMMGRDELDAIVQDEFGLPEVKVESFTATPREVMKMMMKYYQHSEISDEKLVTVMKDSFLKQPATTYDWRQGLPSGFSDKVLVYNKVGWDFNGNSWMIYNDAAIIDFIDSEREFIVVVMTSGVDFKQIRRLGEMIEMKALTEV